MTSGNKESSENNNPVFSESGQKALKAMGNRADIKKYLAQEMDETLANIIISINSKIRELSAKNSKITIDYSATTTCQEKNRLLYFLHNNGEKKLKQALALNGFCDDFEPKILTKQEPPNIKIILNLS